MLVYFVELVFDFKLEIYLVFKVSVNILVVLGVVADVLECFRV